MRLISILLTLLSCLAVSTSALDAEMNAGGEFIPLDESSDYTPRSVIVENTYVDKDIGIFWQDSASDDTVHMFDVLRQSTGSLQTYNNHQFFAKEIGKEERLSDKFHVVAKTKVYTLGPNKSKINKSFVRDGIIQSNRDENGTYLDSPIKIIGARTAAMSVKFICHCKGFDYYYDDGGDGVFQGSLTLGKETTINTYEGHTFYFTEKDNKSKELARFLMTAEKYAHVVKDPADPVPAKFVAQALKEEKFQAEYRNRTGMHWRSYYGPNGPRPPPALHMWSAEAIGDTHKVISTEGFWNCIGTAATCQSKDPVHMELQVASLAPRAFLIPKFLSDFETDEIIRLAKPQIHVSLVGDYEGAGVRTSDTRTSKNAWVGRSSNDVTESLYLRAAHLLKLDEKLLQTSTNAEDLQVVHYVNGQKYDSHHDWGVSGFVESRYITLLLYLTDMEDENAGGETSFPKGADGLGFKVSPRKGSAVLFYNLLADGNGDDLALHAALPVWRGEKWLANFWVWDPVRK